MYCLCRLGRSPYSKIEGVFCHCCGLEVEPTRSKEMRFVDVKELNAGLWFGLAGSIQVIVLLSGTAPFLKVETAVKVSDLGLIESSRLGSIRYIQAVVTPP